MTERNIVFLVADGGMEQMLRGFFRRGQAHSRLHCAPFTHEIIVSPTKDPGVYNTARELLRPYELAESHAVVMVDAAWEGSPGADAIRETIEGQLHGVWKNSAVIVLDPELEVWFWRDSPELGRVLNIPAQYRGKPMRELLPSMGPSAWPAGQAKPTDPKEALMYLRKSRQYRADKSNAVFRRVAELSFKGCTDPAFKRLLSTLQTWFPPEYAS
ncbi:methylation-associated defense system protein MAD4 [Streptomyces atroolivaceus]|uniref:methylation-associated defense system protein MAD4 n=1 Tax=Streptomyces atroolivaceus TaxID=66869 RepID=UPI0036270820